MHVIIARSTYLQLVCVYFKSLNNASSSSSGQQPVWGNTQVQQLLVLGIAGYLFSWELFCQCSGILIFGWDMWGLDFHGKWTAWSCSDANNNAYLSLPTQKYKKSLNVKINNLVNAVTNCITHCHCWCNLLFLYFCIDICDKCMVWRSQFKYLY